MCEDSVMPTRCSSLTLHPMTRQHLKSVIRIEREIYPFPWSVGNFADSVSAGYDALVVPQNDHAGEVEEADPLLAYAVMMHVLDETHLLNLSVSHGNQRRGVGRQLLRQLMRRSVERGSRGMFLEVRPSNESAVALYESEGFKRVGLRRNYYPAPDRTREDAIVMRCALDRKELADEYDE